MARGCDVIARLSMAFGNNLENTRVVELTSLSKQMTPPNSKCMDTTKANIGLHTITSLDRSLQCYLQEGGRG